MSDTTITTPEENERHRKHGANLFLLAKASGWVDEYPNNGEGPLDCIMRQAYNHGKEDV